MSDPASGTSSEKDSLTFVLVAGAWFGGWVWSSVSRELEKRGHTVVAPSMPGMTPGEDPSKVRLEDAVSTVVGAVRDRELDDVVLVAHDWSGYPVTAAAHRLNGKVRALIYWSAFVPRPGESQLDTIPAEDQQTMREAARALGGDRVLLPYARWSERFLPDVPEEVQRVTYRLLVPQPWAYRTETLRDDEARLPEVPIAYLLGTADRALPPQHGGWTKHVKRAGVEPVLFDAPHAAYFTDPVLVADNLIRAATGV